MEPEGSLPCSQEPSTGPYPEPENSIRYFQLSLSLNQLGGLNRGRYPRGLFNKANISVRIRYFLDIYGWLSLHSKLSLSGLSHLLLLISSLLKEIREGSVTFVTSIHSNKLRASFRRNSVWFNVDNLFFVFSLVHFEGHCILGPNKHSVLRQRLQNLTNNKYCKYVIQILECV
jgi:hypothetical protein